MKLKEYATKRRSTRPGVPLAERILSLVAAGPNGCWIWAGSVNNVGYGYISVGPRTDKRNVLAHRASYEQFVGPIPDGLVIDHLCRTPRCVRPDHLEPVTQQENVLRSPIAIAARYAARTHCNNGHEYTPENTEINRRSDNPEKTYRRCGACRRDRVRAQRQAEREATQR